MPVIAVVLASGGAPVRLYHGPSPSPFSAAQLTELGKLGGVLTCQGSDTGSAGPASEAIVLALESDGGVFESGVDLPDVDGVVGRDGTLVITNPTRIVPSTIMTMRKRMATPITTPAALQELQEFSGVEATADVEAASAEEMAAFDAHLQTMSGTSVNPSAAPVTCSAGLPTIASLWLALEALGGANILMCSTA